MKETLAFAVALLLLLAYGRYLAAEWRTPRWKPEDDSPRTPAP